MTGNKVFVFLVGIFGVLALMSSCCKVAQKEQHNEESNRRLDDIQLHLFMIEEENKLMKIQCDKRRAELQNDAALQALIEHGKLNQKTLDEMLKNEQEMIESRKEALRLLLKAIEKEEQK